GQFPFLVSSLRRSGNSSSLEFSSRSSKGGEQISETARDIRLLLRERMHGRNRSWLTSSLTRSFWTCSIGSRRATEAMKRGWKPGAPPVRSCLGGKGLTSEGF